MILLLGVAFCGLTLLDVSFLILVARGPGVPLVAVSQLASLGWGIWRLKKSDQNVLFYLDISFAKGDKVVPELWQEGLIVLGAWLLVLPGFLGDLLGALILIESSRKTIFEGLTKFFSRLTQS